MSDLKHHLQRNLVQAEQLGEEERAAKLRKRLKSLEPKPAAKPKAKHPAKKKTTGD